MNDHEANLVAAWKRALDRGQFRLGGDVDAETCAENWPGYNAQELCMQAAREAIERDDDILHTEHFEAASDALDAVDDRFADDPGEPTGAADGAAVDVLEARVDDLESRVDRLEAKLLEVTE